MFSNRLCLICAAAISFLIVPGCSKQTDDDDGSGAGNTPGSGKSLGSGTGTNTGNNTGTNSSTDPNAVGTAQNISEELWDAIQKNACNAWAIEPESAPAKLQLVVDISSSMNQTANGTGQRSKWEVTREALIEAICGVTGPGLANNTSVGLMFYPNKVNEAVSSTPTTQDVCLNLEGITPMAQLESGDGSHRETLRDTFATVQLGRGTPTADAYQYALDNIALSAEQLAVPGDTYMLLITDGRPTLYHDCYNPAGSLSDLPGDEIVALVRGAWQEHQVKSFIIGSPGSEGGRDWLSQAAYEGQTAKQGCTPGAANGPYCHMDMTSAPNFSVALREGLNQVVAAVSGCKFQVPKQSANGLYTVNTDDISPLINWGNGTKQLITRHNASSACDEGYRLIEGGAQVELCDGTCSRFTADPNAKMQLIFGCADELETNLL